MINEAEWFVRRAEITRATQAIRDDPLNAVSLCSPAFRAWALWTACTLRSRLIQLGVPPVAAVSLSSSYLRALIAASLATRYGFESDDNNDT